jgi:hypothetical protein
MTYGIPDMPQTKVAQDLFSLHGENYVVTEDYRVIDRSTTYRSIDDDA